MFPRLGLFNKPPPAQSSAAPKPDQKPPPPSHQDLADLSRHAYHPNTPPPEGWTPRRDILDPETSAAKGQAYQRGDEFVVAYPGTGEQNGWANNRQVLGLETAAHKGAREDGQKLAKHPEVRSENLTVTGHSQGGGHAQVFGAAFGGNPRVVTINPAGVHPNTHQGDTPSSNQTNLVTGGDPLAVANRFTDWLFGAKPSGPTVKLPPNVPTSAIKLPDPPIQMDDWSGTFRDLASQTLRVPLANHSIPRKIDG